tara:strand:+ start:765 stop:866 length:102 start_codon:yes stop_codon:yes gene_type:complete
MKMHHNVYNFPNRREYTLQEDDIEHHRKDMLFD